MLTLLGVLGVSHTFFVRGRRSGWSVSWVMLGFRKLLWDFGGRKALKLLEEVDSLDNRVIWEE